MAAENPNDGTPDVDSTNGGSTLPEESRRPGRSRRAAVAGIVVVLLVACSVLGYLVWQDHREDELRRSAAEDASRLVVQLASYDHTDVDANLDAVTAEATSDFAERYREVSEGLRELLSSGEGTSVGSVPHAAVESIDTGSAVVLLFLDQEITNVTVPEGRVDTSRMVVTLVRDGNRWLLDSAELA
ncbi:hypothetical protein G6027_14815 [Dietzia sp. SLG310A2-38A2]|uniref:hypothetical protein n=1 Tax=Dietzia sp. SLG310A2-38A2 TaxID=1630643 RepID=UPI0015F9897F|nr:hypothetical protein [Dietzia sp. SLG310A2-38A2]MBB1032127.1 hypothetical protein [Dietzia sp. SLG310A2-38A2]